MDAALFAAGRSLLFPSVAFDVLMRRGGKTSKN
jgi:hypothetical protein